MPESSTVSEKSRLFAVRIVRLYQYLCNEKKEYVNQIISNCNNSYIRTWMFGRLWFIRRSNNKRTGNRGRNNRNGGRRERKEAYKPEISPDRAPKSDIDGASLYGKVEIRSTITE